VPLAEMQDTIVELRSQTMGVGFFNWEFDRLQEVPEPLAKRVLLTSGNGNANGKS